MRSLKSIIMRCYQSLFSITGANRPSSKSSIIRLRIRESPSWARLGSVIKLLQSICKCSPIPTRTGITDQCNHLILKVTSRLTNYQIRLESPILRQVSRLIIDTSDGENHKRLSWNRWSWVKQSTCKRSYRENYSCLKREDSVRAIFKHIEKHLRKYR